MNDCVKQVCTPVDQRLLDRCVEPLDVDAAIAVTSLALVARALEGGTPAFSSRTPPQGASIELDNPAEATHAHREVGSCSSL
jgi:hypothetical protein